MAKDNERTNNGTQRKIPNFNTISTAIDRLSIENVKLAHFQNAIEHDSITDEQRKDFERKVTVQLEMIDALKRELTILMKEAFANGEYAYAKEERTFK